MVKSKCWNSNFGPSGGAKVKNFSEDGIFGFHGRLNKFKGHNPSENLMKDDQNFKRRDVKKEGSNKTGESTMALGPTHRPFLNT